MFLALWNYIRGYAIICVTGFSVERFINLAVNHGIFIWDVCLEKNKVVMKARIKSEDDLKECGIKTGCRFEIIGEYGLPVFLKRCFSRKIYAVGLLAFSLIMYVMSSFIWTVRIEGNERLQTEDITESCRERGIAPGRFKAGLDLYEIGESLMLEYKDISWIALNVEGTGVTVKIVETIPETQYVEREKPTDVIASSDGKIVKMAVSQGTPLVKEGDEVKKGDVLVSNAVALKDGEVQTGGKYVCAAAEVYAEKNYELEGKSSLIYNENVFTGDSKTDYSLNVGNKNFNYIKPSDMTGWNVLADDSFCFDIGDYRVPFGINKTVYGKFKTDRKKRTEEEAIALAEKMLDEKIASLTMESGAEVTKLYTETINNGLDVTIVGYVTVVMRIDEQREVYIDYEEVME